MPTKGPRDRQPVHDDPTTWLQRFEVARILGLTRNGVFDIEHRGGLHPIRNARGDKLFDPDEVQAWAIAHPKQGRKLYDDGDIAAAAFKLFSDGKTRREVVIELRITCDRVDKLYEQYRVDDLDVALAARRAAERRAGEERERAARDRRRRRVFDALKTLQAKPSPRR